jgi:SSS family solute:Na+ symporter
LHLNTLDYAILIAYFVVVIAVGIIVKRRIKTSQDFLTSRHSVPLWATSLAFIAANLGAQELIGMCASSAKYGMMTAHFYFAAIPPMIFVGLFMMPFYYGSRARSVPEYLRLRFDEKTRTVNACSFAVMTIFSSGISMYALGLLLERLLGWSFDASVLLSAGVVLAYTFLGGLTSAIYNEVLQFGLSVLGFAPLSVLVLIRCGGWHGITARLPAVMTHVWRYSLHSSQNPMGVDGFGLSFGLGFVLAFGYWCTDFLVLQRAMAARSTNDARMTPVIAAFPKMAMPLIVIVPGLAALALTRMGEFSLPVKGAGYDYDQVLLTLLYRFYPAGLMGLGLTALMASFMSGMAGNVTAFNTVWTYDIYQGLVRRNAPDAHYLRVGRITTVVGVVLSIAAAYLAQHYNNIMDLLQLVFGFVNAPLFATFLLGMFWKRATGHGAFCGLLSGTAAAALTHGGTMAEGKGGWLLNVHTFPSVMAQNFWIAIVAWTACFTVTILVSLVTAPKPAAELEGLVHGAGQTESGPLLGMSRPLVWGGVALVAWAVLNVVFW